MKEKTIKVKEKQRVLNANKPFLITVCVLFGIYCVTLVFPFIWLIINSLKGTTEFLRDPIGMPTKLLFSNYSTMFVEFNLPQMFINTLLICFIIPSVSLLVANGAAYAVAKFKFALRSFCYTLAMINIYVSIAGTLPTTYKLMNNLGLIDSLLGLVVMGSGGFSFDFLLLHGIYINISNEYREAAEIDGAGYWRIFLQIYFPQVFTTTLSLWLLSFIGQWNNYTSPYLFWHSAPTLATGIKTISDAVANSKEYSLMYPKLFAAMVITIIPVILIFTCLQRPISKVSAGGGIKG